MMKLHQGEAYSYVLWPSIVEDQYRLHGWILLLEKQRVAMHVVVHEPVNPGSSPLHNLISSTMSRMVGSDCDPHYGSLHEMTMAALDKLS